jgi:hypothetical protein
MGERNPANMNTCLLLSGTTVLWKCRAIYLDGDTIFGSGVTLLR